MKYVIRNDYRNTFYMGGGEWTTEYPDAMKYNDIGIVMRIIDEMPIGQGIVAIENYGLENEKEVY